MIAKISALKVIYSYTTHEKFDSVNNVLREYKKIKKSV